MDRIYNKVDVVNTGEEDEIVDMLGVIGKSKHYRETIVLKEITREQLINVFKRNNQMKLIMFTISQVDRTGFVTQTEFDDILKLSIPELKDKNLIPIFDNFRSV